MVEGSAAQWHTQLNRNDSNLDTRILYINSPGFRALWPSGAQHNTFGHMYVYVALNTKTLLAFFSLYVSHTLFCSISQQPQNPPGSASSQLAALPAHALCTKACVLWPEGKPWREFGVPGRGRGGFGLGAPGSWGRHNWSLKSRGLPTKRAPLQVPIASRKVKVKGVSMNYPNLMSL